ncbi:hypothetical protein [Brevibacterium sp. XM4083]|uniref:hypothetical protein n=1 Tax=Brevibacterium sp. XM4083 TaxID=2583238 RepID=UPI001129D469|nr:hypothetical protein [Brevibacterium sp. XM4083]MCM1012196.1 hypothetical protein [Brevibacterium sp. XM4083]
MTTLEIADEKALSDLAAFTSLAHRLDPDGAMRLQVASEVLVLTVAPLFPHGIGDSTPLVLAMRMQRLDSPELDGLDEVVPLAALADRFARAENGTSLPLPPTSMLVSWAGIAPPRGPWEQTDTIAPSALIAGAEAGIAGVADGTPDGAGSHAVKALRARVWAAPLTGDHGTTVPAGLAFAAAGLRFLPPSASAACPVMESAGWLRVVTPGGHLLTRKAA